MKTNPLAVEPDRSGGRTPLPPPDERRRLPPDGGEAFNRLIFESSPYLLQHARNPVDWRPWGADAFAAARAADQPIFLSIGYSTCHWCHVMEHESFENAAIAAILNQYFVSIKIDREERPDVDAVYMAYVQAVTGGGGWPMSVWLTPELTPFLGGTYYPPEDRWGRPGFRSVLQQVAEAWAGNRDNIRRAGTTVIARLREFATPPPPAAEPPPPAVFSAAVEELHARQDPVHGGFDGAPKFPRPAAPLLLLRHHARTGDAASLAMAEGQLAGMAAGGIHDHLGGGFHRYAVDARWHVPHFEKMLYDQAQLAWLFTDAWRLTGKPAWRSAARGILDYVRRDLTAPGGGFYSAEDADSPRPEHPAERAEGAYYVWTRAEIDAVLAPELAAAFCARYGVRAEGNVTEDPHGEFTGRNVLITSHDPEEPEAAAALADARAQLLAARAHRPRPQRDDKIVTAWNGLMIGAYARAYQAFGESGDLRAAQRAAAFLRTHHVDPATGRLWRRSMDGAGGIAAVADDYAGLIHGLLDLFEAGFDPDILEWAIALQDDLDARFRDPTQGGYYRTAGDDPSVLVRMQEDYDGAEPAPGSLATLNLARLARVTGSERFTTRAEATLRGAGARLAHTPSAMPLMLMALDTLNHPARHVAIAGTPGAPDTDALLKVARDAPPHPDRIILRLDGAAGQARLAVDQPHLREMRPLNGRATAYVCEGFVCREPTTDPTRLAEMLGRHA